MDALPVASVTGIDVGKDKLDVAIGVEQPVWEVSNDSKGIAEIVARLRDVRPALIVLESSGGYERALATELYAAKLPVSMVHPARPRAFARAEGVLAKSDPIDARGLARFGAAIHPAPTRLPTAEEQTLIDLVTRRRQVLEMRVAERNRLGTALPSVQERITRHLSWLEQELEDLDKEINDFISRTRLWEDKDRLLRTVNGVGKVVSGTLLALLPELGQLNKKQIGALVGVAPMNDESGHRKGQRHIKGGRPDIRAVLYMATLSAIRYNPVIGPFYRRLVQRGKIKKVAVIAAMHKLLTILNAMMRDNQPFCPPATASASS